MSSQHRAAAPRNPLSRIGAALLGVAAMVVAMVALAPAASAHDAPINGTATCVPDGTWSVSGTATLKDVPPGDNGKTTVTITSTKGTVSQNPSSSYKPDPANDTVYQYTVSGIPGSARSVKVTATTKWPNNGVDTQSKTVYRPSGGCQPTAKYVTVVWQMPYKGLNGSYPTWPQDYVTSNTSDKKTLKNVDVPTQCGTAYQIDVYLIANVKKTFNDWQDRLKPGQTLDTVNGVPQDSSWFDGKEGANWRFVINPPCETTATLATPTVNPAQCTENTAGETVWESVSKPADGNGLTYSMSGPDANHKVTVTATLASGYVFPSSLPTGWTKTGESHAQWTYTLQSKKCDIVVTPGAVTFDDQCGTNDDTYTIPSTEGVEYLVGEEVVKAGTYPGSGTVTVTAKAAEGYVLAKDVTTSWTHTFTDESCGTTTSTTPPTTTPTTPPTTTPAVPTTVTPGISGPQCVLVGTAEQITVSTVTVNGISYTVTGDGTASVTVRAVANDGFVLSVPAGWTANTDGSATIVVTPDSNGVICVGGESSSVDNLTPTTKSAAASTGSIEVLPTSETVQPSTIAYTGVNTSQMAMLALLLLAGGALILGVGTMWRRKPRKH